MQRFKTFLSGEKPATGQRSWLLLGGTGTLSQAVTEHLRHSSRVICLNRGSRALPTGVEQIVCDATDQAALHAALAGRSFDVAVDFIAHTPDVARMHAAELTGRCGRYVYISTAAAYEKPPRALFQTEKTPLFNPHDRAVQQRILCEGVLRDAWKRSGLPLTILRPGTSYGDGSLPFCLQAEVRPGALVHRLRAGKPIVVPGDGQVFRSLTHAMDFARALEALALHPDAAGEDFHIAGDECHTWNDVARLIAQAAGAPEPKLVHVATDALVRLQPSLRAPLLGDLACTAVYDNSKLRSFVPEFRFIVPLKDGLKQSLMHISPEADPAWDAWTEDVVSRFG